MRMLCDDEEGGEQRATPQIKRNQILVNGNTKLKNKFSTEKIVLPILTPVPSKTLRMTGDGNRNQGSGQNQK